MPAANSVPYSRLIRKIKCCFNFWFCWHAKFYCNHDESLLTKKRKEMLHKRYSYKRPLILVAIVFAFFLRTSTVSQDTLTRTNSVSENNKNYVALNRNSYPKRIILYRLYQHVVTQFL